VPISKTIVIIIVPRIRLDTLGGNVKRIIVATYETLFMDSLR